MARSPAAEEEDAGTGSGGWRGRPRYAVGAEVEVLLTEPGFRGARYEATIAARLPDDGGYEVVFSTLLARRRGSPLREVAAATDVRPRPPPPPPPGHEIKLFDLVEAYDSDGWWPGVVSRVCPKLRRKQETRYAVSFPLFRQVVERPASLVRPRREFVCGSWIDAQEVLRGIPLYAEGSSIEVMWDEEKQGRAWMPATIVKMVGGTNYAISYGNGEGPIEVLHSRFIRPQPIFDKIKFEYELELSAEVEVYRDGIWSLGVIADVGNCEPRRYLVRVKLCNNADEYGYFLVSGASLRPYSKWDGQEWRPCSTKKHPRKRNYSDSDYSPEFSTSGEDSDQYSSDCSPEFLTSGRDCDQYSSIPNKRVKKENVQKEELHLRNSLNLRQDTDRSPSKDAMDVKTLSEKHATGVKKLESQRDGLGFKVAKGKEEKLSAKALQKLIYTRCDGKGRRFVPKALASKRKELHSVSPLEDIVKTGSKSNYFDVVVISDESGYGNFIEISDNSSLNPNRKKRRMNLPDKELHSNHSVHWYQASQSASNLLQPQNPHHDLSLKVTRHSEERACRRVLSHSVVALESSQDPSHKDGEQLIPLPGCPVQGLLRTNETKEPELSDHLYLESAMLALDDSAAGDENHEMCQKITEVKSWMAGTYNEGADVSLINSRISNQKTVDQLCVEAIPIGKLEPSSVLQDVKPDLLCTEAPNSNKMKIKNKRTGMPLKEEAAFPIGKLEPSSSGQQDVKADLSCIQAPNDNRMEIKNERTGLSPEAAAGFHLKTHMHSSASLQPLAQPQVLISGKSAGSSSFMHPGMMMMDLSTFMPLPAPNSSTLPPVFSTSSLLLMPDYKMEVFKKLQQTPHFREEWDCPPEFREGKALGLMVSFANMAESIKNMQIQDGPRLYQEKMSSLLHLEENGFAVGALKVRLHNLLCQRNRQIDLKNRKASLEKEILEIETVNCGLEQRLKILDMCIMGLEAKQYLDMKVSLDTQKAVNCSSISKLLVDLHQVEESLVSAEANFNSIAAAPW